MNREDREFITQAIVEAHRRISSSESKTMIEMRWLLDKTRPAPNAQDGYTLQYRYRENMSEEGLEDTIWSNWIDVPYVSEG